MMPTPFRRPINWNRLRTDEAERLVHERSADRSNVIIGDHAFDRINEREIISDDVYWILESGYVDGGLVRNEHGDWELIMVRRMPGGREAGVVTIVFVEGQMLFVKTVEWMDLKR
jgi:hypothetical protein